MRWLAVWAMGVGAALAAGPEDGPEVGFFEGSYELVGRGPGGALVTKKMALRVEGEGLAAEGCGGEAGALAWARVHESWKLVGRVFGTEVSCGYAVDAGNYPILNCLGPEGVRLTAWPEGEFGLALACE